MNEKVGLSSDMGDECSSQTARKRKEQSDNARWPQLSLFLVTKFSFLSYSYIAMAIDWPDGQDLQTNPEDEDSRSIW